MWQFVPHTIPMLVSFAAAVVAIAYTWPHRRNVPLAHAFCLHSAVTLFWPLGAALELSATTLELKLAFLGLEYIGIALVPPTMLVFVLRVVGVERFWTPLRLALLLALPLAVLVSYFVPAWRPYLQADSVIEIRNGLVLRHAAGNVLFQVFTLYAWGLGAVALVLLIRQTLRPSPLLRRQALAVIFALLAPLGFSLYSQLVSFPSELIDITAWGWAAGIPAYVWAVRRHHMFRLWVRARDLVIEQLRDPVLMVDVSGTVVDVNPAARALLSDDGERLVGRPLAALLPDLQGHGTEVVRGSRTFEVRITALDGGRVITMYDVTTFKEALEAREQARAAAVAAAQERADFLARMSHEIRTPLYGVMGAVELLHGDEARPERTQLLEVISRSGQSLLTLVNEVLDFSRLEAERMALESAPFRPARVVQDVATLFTPTAAGKGLTLTADAPDDVRVLGDAHRLRQVLQNLVANAVKFTAQGGVTVKLSHAQGDGGTVVVRLAVTDTGPGIPEAARARVFDAFVQADGSTARKHGGSGLGLAICQRLVQGMGGDISLETQLGVGTTFQVILPLPEAPPEAPRVETPRPTPRGWRVLVVDDHPVNRMVTRLLLEREGASALAVSSGEAALAMLENRRFDLLLTDLRMPDLDGLQLARRVRARRHPTPIAILTADLAARPADVTEVDGWLGKPFGAGELRTLLERFPASASPVAAAPSPSSQAVIDAFVETSTREVAALLLATERDDFVAVRALAHRLGGSAGFLGLQGIARLCAGIEQRAGDEDTRDAAQRVAAGLDEEIAALRRHGLPWEQQAA